MNIEVAGERLELLAERAVFWPARRTLIIADTHWGKSATLRAAPLPVPPGTTTEDLERLSGLLERTAASRLVILGDLIHARQGRKPKTLDAITRWRERWRELEVLLIRGNHDVRAGDPPAEWGFACVDEPWPDAPFVYRHVPGRSDEGYVLAGHLHPKARLVGPGGEALRLPCFRFGERSAIVPAFSGLAEGGGFQPQAGERVFVIAGEEVLLVDSAR